MGVGPAPERQNVQEREMRVLHVNDYDMAYIEHGTGVPLLLVHGALCDLRYWTPQIGPFSQGYRLIAVSLRHFWPARWNGDGNDFTTQQHTEDVAAFITALGTGSVHLIGHSRGGYVAFQVARHFPDRVRSLVLAEPGGSLDTTLQRAQPRPGPGPGPGPGNREETAPFDAAAGHIRRGELDRGLAIFVDTVSAPGAWEGLTERAKQMMRDNACTLLGQIREERPPIARADVEAIRAPTLLIGGERSPPIYREILDALEASLRDVRRVTIPGASHPMNHDNAAAFNKAVVEFLAARPT
jgi:pimeloyl-ACP methyl ester carboxylesterase